MRHVILLIFLLFVSLVAGHAEDFSSSIDIFGGLRDLKAYLWIHLTKKRVISVISSRRIGSDELCVYLIIHTQKSYRTIMFTRARQSSVATLVSISNISLSPLIHFFAIFVLFSLPSQIASRRFNFALFLCFYNSNIFLQPHFQATTQQ